MNKITKIWAEEIKDSKRNPTIKVTVWAGETSGSFSVPSGASTGVHEAHELRDSDGKGVMKALDKVNNTITPSLIGQDILNQKEIDRLMIELDGTSNKDNLGGNSIVGVSIACAKTAAKINNQEVYEYLRTLATIKPSRKTPHLFMNLFEGGKHTSNILAFQEYMVVPQVDDAEEAVQIGIKICDTIKLLIKKELGEDHIVLGDEGGFALPISDIRQPLLYLSEAVKENNLQDKVRFSLDVASSSFYQDGIYKIDGKNARPNDYSPPERSCRAGVGRVSKEELMNIYYSLVKEFNLFSVEDPFEQEDFESFKELKESSAGLLVVGDDLTVSNHILLEKAIKIGSINAVIIKPNQIGTLSETLETMILARENGIELIVSHRGEETDDDFIADLAYAFGCFGLKAGSPLKSERMLKYQRLTEISK